MNIQKDFDRAAKIVRLTGDRSGSPFAPDAWAVRNAALDAFVAFFKDDPAFKMTSFLMMCQVNEDEWYAVDSP